MDCFLKIVYVIAFTSIIIYFCRLFAWIFYIENKFDKMISDIIEELVVFPKNILSLSIITIKTIIKNRLINLILIISIVLIFIYKQYSSTNLDNKTLIDVLDMFLGVIASIFASFNLIDSFKEYQIKKTKIIIITKIKVYTDELFAGLLKIIEPIFDNEAKQKNWNKETKDIVNKITTLRISLENLKQENLDNLKDLSILIRNYCRMDKFSKDDIEFKDIRFTLQKMRNLILSQINIIGGNEKLSKAYAELELILSQLDSKENIPISNRNDITTITDFFYLIYNCYQSIIPYEKEMSDETDKRYKKHHEFFKNI